MASQTQTLRVLETIRVWGGQFVLRGVHPPLVHGVVGGDQEVFYTNFHQPSNDHVWCLGLTLPAFSAILDSACKMQKSPPATGASGDGPSL